MRGDKIYTLEELVWARTQKRAVVCSAYCFRKPTPAAWVINLSGDMIHKLISGGMWVYQKPNFSSNLLTKKTYARI